MTRCSVGRAAAATLALLLAVLVPLAAPAAGQAEGELVLENVDATGFPLVRAVVSGPALTGELDDAFVVTEDGEEISPDVVRLRSDELNVVLALDVSGSMAGDPLDKAKVAVESLLASLPETVPVAVVSFGDTAVLQSNFTTDRPATLAAVQGLVAAGGTALYDGLDLGMAQLDAQGGTGAMVVLADGDDTDSSRTLADATTRFSASGVEASYVALETDNFDPDTFDALAAASGGDVLTVDDAEGFAGAFEDVAAGLGNLYEIRWRSSSTVKHIFLAAIRTPP